MPVEIAELLSRLDGRALLQELYPDAPPPDSKGWSRVLCPFHADTAPSLGFNVETKGYHCLACGASGSVIDLVSQLTKQPRWAVVELYARRVGASTVASISPQLVEGWHQQLTASSELLAHLLARKGLDLEAVKRWRLGWNLKLRRLTIPVRDESGAVVNVRLYDLLKVHDPKIKMINVKGHGELRLYPVEQLASTPLVLAEGELKALHLIQRGFAAVSPSGGANSWADAWDGLFTDKDVNIAYDIDPPGVVRSRELARRLTKRGARVKVLAFPLDPARYPHGDVIDYFQSGCSSHDFQNLVLGTTPYSPDQPVPAGLRDDLTYEVDLSSASKAQYFQRKVRTGAIVSAKDTAPYIVPRSLRVVCTRDLECCVTCPVFETVEGSRWDIEADEPVLLELIDVSTKNQLAQLRELIGIPKRCGASEVIIDESHNLEEIRLVPQLTIAGRTHEQVVVKAYHVGHGIETNEPYGIEGRVAVTPKTQHATLLINHVEPRQDSLTQFNPTDEELQELEIFRPTEDTLADLDRKLKEIYADFETHVTRIYDRSMLHTVMDLAWHSVLHVSLGGITNKGWLDVLVIGDSGQGKSETALRLLQHFGLGERVDLKGASVAGLKGGLQDVQGRWFITWGVIPLHDRRLLVLEEVKGAAPEVLQSLTDMRSSGIAEIAKIEKRRTHARTRLIWISNPRSDRQVSTYNFGVEVIKELMGSLEDVRRFDLAIVVVSGEVKPETISSKRLAAVKPPVYLSALCQRLILWAWSRRPEDVIFDAEAEAQCFELAVSEAKAYSASIPLVEPADQRFKLARIAAAVAARTFSTDESRRKLLVHGVHVRFADKLLETIYSATAMGYHDYSKLQQLDANVGDSISLQKELTSTPHAVEVVRGLLRTNKIHVTDFTDWAGLDKDEARRKLAFFVRRNALRRRGSNYYKTGAFIEVLKITLGNLSNGAQPEAAPAPAANEEGEY